MIDKSSHALDRSAQSDIDEQMSPESQRAAEAEPMPRLVLSFAKEGEHLVSKSLAERSRIEPEQRAE
jgi:hypothetical protein